jgi:hypothetical protein
MNRCQKDIEDRRALLQEQIYSFGLGLGPVPNLFAGHLPSGSLKLGFAVCKLTNSHIRTSAAGLQNE